MADTVVSGAVVSPHDEGLPSISDGDEDWQSAGMLAALGQGVPSASYVRSDSELTFTNHDGTNDQVDVTAGIAYLALAGETWNVQSTRGGSTPPNYDTAITADTMPAICVVVPSGVSNVDLQDSASSDIWLAYATDGTVGGVDAGDVYVRSDDTGGVSAPSHPNVKLGSANPDNASADVLENRFPVVTLDELTVDGRFTGPAVSVSTGTTTAGETTLFVDTSIAGVTVTLGSADALLGHAKRIRVTGSNTLTLDTEGSETIDGSSSITITQDDAWVEVASDGDDWFTDRNRDLTALATDSLTANDLLRMGTSTEDISSGAMSYAAPLISIRGEGENNDDLDNITGGQEGDIVFLRRNGGSSGDITIRHAQGGAGQILLDGGTNKTLDSNTDILSLIQSDPDVWSQISFSNPG